MKRLFLILSLCLTHHLLTAQFQKKPKNKFPIGNSFKTSSIRTKLIPCINNTWGYDILIENKLMIHQPTIPALPGNEGFKTKEAAQKVAGLVVNKIKRGEMPPSITVEEMKKLKAL